MKTDLQNVIPHDKVNNIGPKVPQLPYFNNMDGLSSESQSVSVSIDKDDNDDQN